MSSLLIAVGGAVGTLARYWCTIGLGELLGTAFPFGTFAVNLIGSFLLGIIAQALSGATFGGTDLRLILGVGVMGGFTTYSSFNLETLRLFQQGELTKALGYLFGTLVACLAAGAAGLVLARALAGPSTG
jgi:CrcB protein